MVTAKLEGFTVAVTAHRRAEEQMQLLRRHGAKVVHGAVLRTQPLGDDEPLRHATLDLLSHPPDIVIANTAVGMRGWMDAAEAWGLGEGLAEVLRNTAIYARGPKAAGALAPIGATAVWRCPSGQLSGLLAHLRTLDIDGQRVAFQRDGSSNVAAIATLAAYGATVIELPVYEWTAPEDDSPALRLLDAVCSNAVDAVTFTSRPALEALVELAEREGKRAELGAAFRGAVVPVCIGPVCLEGAHRFGFTRAVAPERSILGAMVNCVVDAVGGRNTVLSLTSGHTLVLQGAMAMVDGERLELSARETAVLHALVRKPSAVVSKATLLAEVWGESEADDHTLEMTVSRLRRRLGTAGGAIKTVVRRGYLLSASNLEQ
jgi:uroporphyrinogen-III synthase